MDVVKILDDDDLLRRLAPKSCFKRDGKTVTRGAFKAHNEYETEISVHVSRLLVSPLTALQGYPNFGLGSLRVRDVRALALM